jgi:lambda family phage portal protein
VSLGNWIDQAIYAVAPAWGARRIVSRRIFEAAQSSERKFRNAYEAAEEDRLRGGRWLMSNLSADAELNADLPTIRRNSRELDKNDFLGGAVDSRVDHAVGKGFTVQARIKGEQMGQRAARVNARLESLWEQVAPTICRTRKKSLTQKLGLVSRLIDTDGEAFVVISDIRSGDAPLPMCIEVIDADRVETPPNKAGDPQCRMGIQYDADGAIVGYWMRTTHPRDDKTAEYRHELIPAARVCHLFVEWLAGQSRGLPWMTRVLNRAKDGKDLAEAGIVASQVQACYAAFVKSGNSSVKNALGAQTSVDSAGNRIQDIKPGSVQYIGSQDDVIFSTPSNSNMVGTLVEYNNRTIAAGLNWPYEMLLKDWRGVSFAGGRIVLNSARLSTQSRQTLLIEGLLSHLWHWFVREAVALGLVDIAAREYQRDPWTFRRHTWTAPKWSYSITPGEEVKAKIDAIDGNLTTLADVLAEDQLDFEEVMEQRKVERAKERGYDILPTKVTQVERPQGTQVAEQQAVTA